MTRRWLAAAAAVAALGVPAIPPAVADPGPCPRVTGLVSPDGPQPHPRCRLQSTGELDLTFEVDYWSDDNGPAAVPRAVRVTILDTAQTVVQTINELLEPSSPTSPWLLRLDGESRDVLVVPLSQHSYNGGVNTRFSVWRANEDGTHFERTQMEGQALYPSQDGYVVTNGGALTTRNLTFYRPTAAGYTLIVSLTITAEQIDPSTRRVLAASCRAHQQEGLQYVGMDVEHARVVFCESPAARAVWPEARRI